MRNAAPLVVLALVLTACASRNRAADGDLSHDPETCTVDGHNHAAEIMAGTKAAAEDAARDAAWYAAEQARKEGAQRSKPRTAQPSDSKKDDKKEEAPDTPQPRIPPPR